MPKKKEYFKLTVECDKSDYVAESIVEKPNIQVMRNRCIKSLVDFIDESAESFNVYVKVEESLDRPVEGVDLTLRLKVAKDVEPEQQDIVVADIEGE